MTMKDDLRMLEQRRAKALAMGSSSRLKEFHEAGVLNVRERIDYLFDDDSFTEHGLLALPARKEHHDRAPGDAG